MKKLEITFGQWKPFAERLYRCGWLETVWETSLDVNLPLTPLGREKMMALCSLARKLESDNLAIVAENLELPEMLERARIMIEQNLKAMREIVKDLEPPKMSSDDLHALNCLLQSSLINTELN